MLHRRTYQIIAFTSAALAALVILGHLTGHCYYKHGGEFSPDTFRGRSYQAYVLGPITIPRYTPEYETVVGRYLDEHGYVDRDATDVRWYHTVGSRVGWTFIGCSFGSPVAWIATDFDDEVGERLVAWSERRPELAKVFWPRIVAWIREDRCADAAELLELLKYGDDPATVDDVEALFEEATRLADEEYGPRRPAG